MRVVVTGAAGMIGANLVHGLNAIGIDDVIAVDDLSDGAEVPQPARRTARRLLRPARLLRALRARRARPHRRRASTKAPAPTRWSTTAGSCSTSTTAARRRCSTPARRRACACSTPRRRPPTAARDDVPRRARVRAAAQRLRLLEAAVRQRRAAHAADGDDAGRRLSLLQRLRPARAAQGPHGVGRVPPLQPAERATGRVKLFGDVRRLRRRRAGARLRLRRRRRRGQPLVPRSIPRRAASSTSAAAGRSRSTTSPSAVVNACARRARRAAAVARRAGRAPARSSTSTFPPRWSASTSASPRPTSAACAPSAATTRSPTSRTGVAATSPGCGQLRGLQAHASTADRPSAALQGAASAACASLQARIAASLATSGELIMFKRSRHRSPLFAAAAFAAVDVNKADQAELEAIKGIGPTISAQILDERKKGAVQGLERPDQARQGRRRRAARPSSPQHGLTSTAATPSSRRRRQRRHGARRRASRRRAPQRSRPSKRDPRRAT